MGRSVQSPPSRRAVHTARPSSSRIRVGGYGSRRRVDRSRPARGARTLRSPASCETKNSPSPLPAAVKTYDALDRRTWAAAVAGATSIARATGDVQREEREVLRRLRVGRPAGPAGMDATRPGVRRGSISNARPCLMRMACKRAGGGGVVRPSRTEPSVTASGPDPRERSPRSGRVAGSKGEGSLAVAGSGVPSSCRSAGSRTSTRCARRCPAESLALAGAGPDATVALTVDRASNGALGT